MTTLVRAHLLGVKSYRKAPRPRWLLGHLTLVAAAVASAQIGSALPIIALWVYPALVIDAFRLEIALLDQGWDYAQEPS